MLEWIWQGFTGRGVNGTVLGLYLVLASPSLVNSIVYLLKPGRNAFVSSLLGYASFSSATLLLFPISESASTDFLTLGIVLFFLNIALLTVKLTLGRGQILGDKHHQSWGISMAIVLAAIATGCLIRLLG